MFYALGSHWRVPSKEVIDLVYVLESLFWEDVSAAEVRVEAVRPNYKAIVTQVRVDGGFQLVSSRGGGEKETGNLLQWQNPQDWRVDCIQGVKSDVILDLFGSLLTGSQITGILHF